MYFYCISAVTNDFFFFSIIFFFVLIFLKDGIFESSEILRFCGNPVNVVFKFYLASDGYYERTFVKGGNFVEDFDVDSLYDVLVPFSEPLKPE